MMRAMSLTPQQLERYARHIMLREIGGPGQQRLLNAHVALVGLGALGGPAALYLAAAGIGTLGLVECDVVDLSNIQRQILYGSADVGRQKLAAACERLRQLNPHTEVVPHALRLDAGNVMPIIERYDIVVDGSDNFPTRYLLNDAARTTPVVHGSVARFEGQVTTFVPGGPCYRCLFPSAPPPGLGPSCQEAGVLGVLPGVVGLLQATEVLKLLLQRGDTLVGRMLCYDALAMEFYTLRYRRDPRCPGCGDGARAAPVERAEEFCAARGPSGS